MLAIRRTASRARFRSRPRCSRLLDQRKAERDKVQATGRIVPLVFFEVLKTGDVRPIGNFKKAWRTARRKAGLPGRLVHDLRRTAVRDFSSAGVPDQLAMALTGHRTRSTFDRYRIVSAADRDVVRRLLDLPAPATVTATR